MKKVFRYIILNFTSRTPLCNEQYICEMGHVLVSQQKPFTLLSSNMVSRNLILTAIYRITREIPDCQWVRFSAPV
jgi:hypothetical protein